MTSALPEVSAPLDFLLISPVYVGIVSRVTFFNLFWTSEETHLFRDGMKARLDFEIFSCKIFFK